MRVLDSNIGDDADEDGRGGAVEHEREERGGGEDLVRVEGALARVHEAVAERPGQHGKNEAERGATAGDGQRAAQVEAQVAQVQLEADEEQ